MNSISTNCECKDVILEAATRFDDDALTVEMRVRHVSRHKRTKLEGPTRERSRESASSRGTGWLLDGYRDTGIVGRFISGS